MSQSVKNTTQSKLAWLDKIPLFLLVLLAVYFSVAPWHPEPHLLEKMKMLIAWQLSKPLDIFDLVLHGSFPILLALKCYRMLHR